MSCQEKRTITMIAAILLGILVTNCVQLPYYRRGLANE